MKVPEGGTFVLREEAAHKVFIQVCLSTYQQTETSVSSFLFSFFFRSSVMPSYFRELTPKERYCNTYPGCDLRDGMYICTCVCVSARMSLHHITKYVFLSQIDTDIHPLVDKRHDLPLVSCKSFRLCSSALTHWCKKRRGMRTRLLTLYVQLPECPVSCSLVDSPSPCLSLSFLFTFFPSRQFMIRSVRCLQRLRNSH